MANIVPPNLRIAMLDQEVVRLRQGTAELEARLRKPTLQQHLQKFLKDYPKLNSVEERHLSGTIIFVLRQKLGSKFSNPDPEDVYIIMTHSIDGKAVYNRLCVTFRGVVVIKGTAQYDRAQVGRGLQEVAEKAALA